jgi:DNA transposition AAA+ family ATPase
MSDTPPPVPAVADGETPLRNAGDGIRASWRYSLDDIRKNTGHLHPDGQRALVDAFLWCIHRDHSLAFRDFSARVGCDPTTLDRLYRGVYRSSTGDLLQVPTKILREIQHVLTLERERAEGGKTDFVLTPTAQKIWTACNLARESQTPVFLWGPSHIGKTWALENYAVRNNHGRTIFIRMKAASGLGGMVRKIAQSLGISDKTNTANLLESIRGAVTEDMLLIFDEVHLLQYTYRLSSFFACMEVLRELYDEAKCGVVFCGTKLLLEKLRQGEHKEMEQLMRRGVHRFPLPSAPTKADIGAILKHAGLEFPDRDTVITVKRVDEKPFELLRQLAKRDGLKAVTERLRYGRKFATKRKEPLGWEHFIEAHLIIAAAATEDDSSREWA